MSQHLEISPLEARDAIARAEYRQLLTQSRQNLIQARKHNDIPAQAQALYGLALSLAYPGDFRDARLLLDAALEDARTHYLPELFCHLLNERGNLLLIGEMQPYSARQHHEEALMMAEDLDNTHSIIIAQIGLSQVENHLKNYGTAQSLAENALQQAEALDDTLLQIQARTQLGRALTGKQYDVSAMECLHDALEMAHEAGYLSEQALIIHYGGLVLLRNKQGTEAIDHQSHALSVSNKLNYAYAKFRALDGLRLAHDAAGNLASTRDACDAMILLSQRSDAPMYEARAHSGRGEMFFRRQQYAQAHYALEQALGIARDNNNPVMEAETLLRIGKVYEAEYDYNRARDAFEDARAIEKSLDNVNMIDWFFWQIVLTYVKEAYDKVLRVTGFRGE